MKVAVLYNEGVESTLKEAYFGSNSPIKYEDTILANIYQDSSKKKTSIKDIREYVETLLIPGLTRASASILIIGDADYFKVLTGKRNAEPFLGYAIPAKEEYGDFTCFYIPNYKVMFYRPEETKDKIEYVFGFVSDYLRGTYIEPGSNIIKHSWFPSTTAEIKEALDFLITKDMDLACDIEAYSLKHMDAGIGSISFSWDTGGGVSFLVDFSTNHLPNREVRELLVDFFRKFNKKIYYHGITYDVYVLIPQLFMKSSLDYEGLLEGIDILLKNWDCTRIISYLALNSCSRPDLGLKALAQEFAGNWAVESENIKDITSLEPNKLLTYNLIDTMSTVYVRDKYEPIMDQDNQREIYETIFKPAVIDIIQMQLTGLPLNMEKVHAARAKLEKVESDCYKIFENSMYVNVLVNQLKEEWVEHKNNTLKVKRVTIDDATSIVFNPKSNPQLQKLLYDIMGLPIIEYTDSKLPSTGGKVIDELVKGLDDTDKIGTELLEALSEFKSIEKILSSFIPAMEKAHLAEDGWHYLHGFFNLGGTVSGRLSSNNPNLQNIPAKGKLAKIIKDCFEAPPGWLFIGLDYSSLEDRISALTTKDPNKLKVYTDLFDGHCLRAYTYFADQMPDIDPNSVESINSIEHKYPDLRQESKTPTFLLTYQGTYKGMAKKCGFTLEKAKQIEDSYKELYSVSIDWVNEKIEQATRDGYITGAFGLRVRTPLLAQVVLNNSYTPYEAQAEARTAGNAVGQSWCLLNSRSSSEFMTKVRTNKKYRTLIRPCAQIHDAFYMMIPNDVEITSYVNKHLVEAVNWNHHPDIYHPDVGLGGELSIFYPTWNDEIVIPNGMYNDALYDYISNYEPK